VLDPPTFSNSKRMNGTLDVARDHPWLIGQALRLLSPREDSALVFSCNNRRFNLRSGDLPKDTLGRSLEIRDMSAETLPFDFHDPRTRCCYLIRRA
jgi:23S rRNA (cytosine1962-C5)-methyltransferase